jgi:heme-degrading monooxygenase HmoA
MSVIVVTRLRLKDPAFFDEFFASAVAVVEQAQGTEGNLGADVLAEANNTYWTRTAWQGRAEMDSFVGSQPHLGTMDRIDEWCDEATFVDWEQSTAGAVDWQDGYRRLVADGQVATLTNGTAAHQARDFPAPVVPDAP